MSVFEVRIGSSFSAAKEKVTERAGDRGNASFDRKGDDDDGNDA
jgi:hypothetical protein